VAYAEYLTALKPAVAVIWFPFTYLLQQSLKFNWGTAIAFYLSFIVSLFMLGRLALLIDCCTDLTALDTH
jgi:hypothetical protein